MTTRRLGTWYLASGNSLNLVVDVGAGDTPAILGAHCEWETFPLSPEDQAEYLGRIQPEVMLLLRDACGVKGKVLVLTI